VPKSASFFSAEERGVNMEKLGRISWRERLRS